MKQNKLILPGILILVIVLADQVTKFWAVANLAGPPVKVLGDFFRFTLVYNEGGAMGTNVGSPTLYLILAIIILPLLVYYIYQNRSSYVLSIPLSLICAGAIGNLTDRIRLGKVVDFIDVDFFDIDLFGYQLNRWWTFNIADAAISCAIVYLLFVISFTRLVDTAKPNPEPITDGQVLDKEKNPLDS